jgi:hypothetical protein
MNSGQELYPKPQQMTRSNSQAEAPLFTHNTHQPIAAKRHYQDKTNMSDIYHHAGQVLPQAFQEEQDIYNYEKLLLEQDAHLLEEQRYLNRLKQSEIRQNKNFSEHYNRITKP